MPVGIGVLKEVERVPSEESAGIPGAGPGFMPIRPAGGGMAGGGAPLSRITRERVLFDPVTNEEISKTYDIVTQEHIRTNPEYTENDLGKVELTSFGDAKFIERDSWFRIQAKFVWKDAPQDLMNQSMGQGMGGAGGAFYR